MFFQEPAPIKSVTHPKTVAQNEYKLPTIFLKSPSWKSVFTGHPVPIEQKTTVVVYVSADCPIVQRYRPELRRQSQAFPAADVDWRFVYLPADGNRAQSSFHESKWRGQAVFEPGLAVAKTCGAKVKPTALVFNAKGQLTYRGRIDDRASRPGDWQSQTARRDLYEAIRQTLAGKAVTIPQTDSLGCFLPFVVEGN